MLLDNSMMPFLIAREKYRDALTRLPTFWTEPVTIFIRQLRDFEAMRVITLVTTITKQDWIRRVPVILLHISHGIDETF